MKIRSLLLMSAAASLAAPGSQVAAQEPTTSKMFLSFFVGAIQTSGDIWSLGAQRVGVIPLTGGPEVAVDTFRLRRNSRPGLALGINGTYFPSSTLGYSFELSLFNPGIDTDCEIVFDSQPATGMNTNRGFCEDISRRGDSMGTVNVMLGAVYRPIPNSAVRPYLRLAAGAADMGSGSTEVVGRLSVVDRVIVVDQGAGYQPTFAGALGLTFQTSPGYAVRMEFRDQLYNVLALSGPADALGLAPTVRNWTHNFSLVFGVDIVLEKRRGRRY